MKYMLWLKPGSGIITKLAMLTNCSHLSGQESYYGYTGHADKLIAAIYPVKKATTATLAMLKNCSHLSGQESYYGYTHACIKLHTEAMS